MMRAAVAFNPFNEDIRPLLRGRVLDVGCGYGNILVACGSDSAGVDPDRAAIRQCRKNGLNAVYGFAEEVPFRSGTFDTVTAISVLEHVDDVGKTLSEARRVLRTGGTIIVKTPYAYDSNAWTHWQHKRCFTLDSLAQWFGLSGFAVRDAYHFWHVPLENRLPIPKTLRFPIRNNYVCKLFATANLIRDCVVIGEKTRTAARR
jgi:SAM-dependent methyltransferase